MALGDFSPSNMCKLILSLDDAMNDSRVQQRHQLMPPIGILDWIKTVETANWNSVRPADRYCEDFDVTWLQESDTAAVVHTNQTYLHRAPCAISGEELESQKKTYKIGKSVDYTLKVKDEDCGNIFSWESKVSLGLLQGYKKLLVALAQAMPGYLHALAGDNLVNDVADGALPGNIGTDSGAGYTELNFDGGTIAASQLIPYLTYVSTLNKLQNPIILDGGAFFLNYWDAQAKKGTGAGDVGDANYWAALFTNYRQDIVNMLAAGYSGSMFIADTGNLAMPLVSYFPRMGDGNHVVGDKYIYSVPMPGVTIGGQQVYVDMTYTKAEEQIGSTGRCQLVHTFHMEIKWDIWQAPAYTTDPVTGLIEFRLAPAA